MTPKETLNDVLTLSRPPLVVQVLAIIGHTCFAIPVSIIAIGEFGVLGLALAGFLAWQWPQVARFGSEKSVAKAVKKLAPKVEKSPRSSGNASFDAYRKTLLDRLETEQTNFDGFLGRLRDAKDKSEFDRFLADREKAAT